MESLIRTAADLRDVDVQQVADGDPLPTSREDGDALVQAVSRCVQPDGLDLVEYVWWGGGWAELTRVEQIGASATVAATFEPVAAFDGFPPAATLSATFEPVAAVAVTVT